MNKFKPHLALLLCNAIWAVDYPFYTIVLPKYVRPVGMAAASLTVAALIALLPVIWRWTRWYLATLRAGDSGAKLPPPRVERVDRRDIRKLVGVALLIGVLRKVFLMYGLSRTSPIDGSIIDTIVPVLVLTISVLIGIDRVTRRKSVGLAMGMAGAVAVVLSGGSSTHEKAELWGNILILLSACASAFYLVLFKEIVSKYRPITVIRWIYCTAAVIALPFGLEAIVHADYTNIAHHALFPTLFVLIVPTFFPNLLLNFGLKYVAPTVASIYTYLQPVLAIAISVAMGLDRLHADTVIFALLLFAGVGIVLSSYTKHPAVRHPLSDGARH